MTEVEELRAEIERLGRVFSEDNTRLNRLYDEAVERAEAAEAVVADYEHRITWDTTCKNCADTLDLAAAQTFRAEEAEAKLARVRARHEQHDRYDQTCGTILIIDGEGPT